MRKIQAGLIILLLCALLSFPAFASGDVDDSGLNKYRILLRSVGSASFDYRYYNEHGIARVAWGGIISFSIAEKNTNSLIDETKRGSFLKGDERPAKGVVWDAILPNGTRTVPHNVDYVIDPSHINDNEDEKTKWELECAYFRIPLEMTGTMTVRAFVDGAVVAEYDVEVTDKNPIDGTLIKGWIWSCKERYFINDNGSLVRDWFRNDEKWYYFNQDGVMQTGWQYLSYKGISYWFYFEPEYHGDTSFGKMYRGWHEIDGSWYYFRKDGSMASNEWINGYWLSASGAWKYQPKGKWRRNSKGWWYEDERGWYPKDETLKINGIQYSFSADGYLVE